MKTKWDSDEVKPYFGPNRRSKKRMKHECVVNFIRKDKSYDYGFIHNFTDVGLYIETEARTPLNENIELLFMLPLSTYVYSAIAKPIWENIPAKNHVVRNGLFGGFACTFESFSTNEDEKKFLDFYYNPPDMSILDNLIPSEDEV